MDIFVLIAEQGESFGMVLAESLLCQTPVVTLATPWGDNSQGEVVGNRLGGFCAATKKELVPLIDRLISDKNLRNTFGLVGRNRIIEIYDSKKVALDALRYLETLISEFDVASPADLMLNTEGKLGLLSKIILISERSFFFLRFSTGYQNLVQIPLFLAKAIARRLLRSFFISKESL